MLVQALRFSSRTVLGLTNGASARLGRTSEQLEPLFTRPRTADSPQRRALLDVRREATPANTTSSAATAAETAPECSLCPCAAKISAQAEKTQNDQNDDHQTDDIDNAVHNKPLSKLEFSMPLRFLAQASG